MENDYRCGHAHSWFNGDDFQSSISRWLHPAGAPTHKTSSGETALAHRSSSTSSPDGQPLQSKAIHHPVVQHFLNFLFIYFIPHLFYFSRLDINPPSFFLILDFPIIDDCYSFVIIIRLLKNHWWGQHCPSRTGTKSTNEWLFLTIQFTSF